MTIAELQEDRVVEAVYAVKAKRKLRTRGGAPYLALELVDPTGKIDARVWSDVELLDGRFAEGDAVRVLGRVERFRDRLQLDVRSLESADVDPGSLTPTARRDTDELHGFLEFLVGELAHPGWPRPCARCSPLRRSRSARRRPTAITPTPAACSSTRSASRRSAGRRRSSIRGCAATCCSPRRSCTTPAGCSSSGRGRRSPSPRKDGCSATSSSAFGSSTSVRTGLTPVQRAELLHCIAVHHDVRPAQDGRGRRSPPRERARRRRRDPSDRLTAFALALGASLAWGVADFVGPLWGRTWGALRVLLWAQVAGVASIAIAVAVRGEGPHDWAILLRRAGRALRARSVSTRTTAAWRSAR